MAASSVQVENNRHNAQRATKQSQAGSGPGLPIEDPIEVARRVEEFIRDLKPVDSVDLVLVRRAAVMSVRMERATEREIESRLLRVFKAVDPLDERDAQLEACCEVALDMSKAAVEARRYEAAAERSYHKALRELKIRQKEREAQAETPEKPEPVEQVELVETVEKVANVESELGSILNESEITESTTPLVVDKVLGEPVEPDWGIATRLQVNQSGTGILPITVGQFR